MWEVKFTTYGLDGEEWDSVVETCVTQVEAEKKCLAWQAADPNELFFVEFNQHSVPL